MAEPDFWNDLERSTRVNQQAKRIGDKIAHHQSLCKRAEDIEAMIELVEEENDASMVGEINGELASLSEDVETLARGI